MQLLNIENTNLHVYAIVAHSVRLFIGTKEEAIEMLSWTIEVTNTIRPRLFLLDSQCLEWKEIML